MKFNRAPLLLTLLPLLASAAIASTTWYVNGVNGSDNNDCKSATTACKTIGHAISLASSGDSIKIASATYTENLTISISLKMIGADASTTIIDGGGNGTVVTISKGTATVLSQLTIRNGSGQGGGISNSGKLKINNSTVSENVGTACIPGYGCFSGLGGGIYSIGTLTINNSTVSGNQANGGCILGRGCSGGFGGGIYSSSLTINESTISGNGVQSPCDPEGCSAGGGGGIYSTGTLKINNSTVSGNTALGKGQLFLKPHGGGIAIGGTATISNSTISGNSATRGGGISGSASLQNTIVANSSSGGNCAGTMTSNGYNLSSDNTCNFNSTGDLNNTDPTLGPLQNNGGPTQTMALPSGSPAIDAGNPNGCKDSNGNLLKTDQRGKPRPDKEDAGGCDMGAYESQSD
jgi:hypothetical protein